MYDCMYHLDRAKGVADGEMWRESTNKGPGGSGSTANEFWQITKILVGSVDESENWNVWNVDVQLFELFAFPLHSIKKKCEAKLD